MNVGEIFHPILIFVVLFKWCSKTKQEKPMIKPSTPGLQNEWFVHYTIAAPSYLCTLCFLFLFVALRPMSTAMVIAGRSVHLTTLFPGQA